MEQWRKNLYLAWLAQILTLAGFGFILPFIPLFIRELGVSDPTSLKLWSGLTAGAPGLVMAVAAPFWGMAADRFGRKVMIVRALASSMVIAVALGFAPTVQTVFVLRALQGLFSGSVTAAATLVAVGTPRVHLTWALGLMGSSTFIGSSLGPLIGGVTADLFGFRLSFFAGAGLIAVGLVLVVLFLQEPGGEPSARRRLAAPQPRGGQPPLRELLSLPFLLLFAVIFLLRFARAQPTAFIPLYVAELRGGSLGAAAGGDAAITGLIMAGSAAVAATAGVTVARLGDRFNKLWLIAISSGLGALVALPTFFAPNLALFALFYILSGFALGSVQPFVQSYLSAHSARARHGMLFGLQNMVGGLGFGLGPLAASWISVAASTRHVFLSYTLAFAGITLVMLAARLLGRRFTRGLPRPPQGEI